MGTDPTQSEQMKQTEQKQQVIGRLSEMVDLVEYQDFIGRKTRYGKKPGPHPWYYTEKLLATYAHRPKLEDFIQAFQAVGVTDEIRAAKWIVIHDELIP